MMDENNSQGKYPSQGYGANMRPGCNEVSDQLLETNNRKILQTRKTNGNRELWSNSIEYVLTCIGVAVGLGNVWRFPYLCYKNGGGAFLIPYVIFLVCCGVPIYFLETSVGQYMGRGPWKAWEIYPLMQGLGAANLVITSLCAMYYIVILAWAAYYCYMSFDAVLSWSKCGNAWNTERCWDGSFNVCTSGLNGTVDNNTSLCSERTENQTAIRVDAVVEFWERKLLQVSGGIDEPGGIIWQLALSLIFVWSLVYFCVFRGVKWTGKVVYFTALFPYVIITVLLIRGATLDGAIDGVIFYLKPDFKSLLIPQVWIDAGTQIFFSFAIGQGVLISLSSHNKFSNDCYKQCFWVSIVNCGTSFYAGFAIFTVLGFMAKQQGVHISEVADKGPGLAFIAYPKAISQLPIPQLWASLFFLMIITLGIDSQFVVCEALLCTFSNAFPQLFRKSPTRELCTAFYCVVTFLISLSMVTNGGIYVFQLFDYYSASGISVLWVCFWECVTIAWFYGANRFYENIAQMIGYKINRWFKVAWMVLAPILTVGTFVFSAMKFEAPKYNGLYEYPLWAKIFGISLALLSMVQIPLVMAIQILRTPGSLKQRMEVLTTPATRVNTDSQDDFSRGDQLHETIKLDVLQNGDNHKATDV
ncbi:sodium- and chloride-dependent taurine transporter-like [Tubulanus polymorphus]|uniref:sodium- and chloride-dependent taurine transporter-like n=1 Tax=Tubulanus polymorphus TaxID=672921 RepID=UPI003DA5F3EA